MATQTTNYEFIKPAGAENADIIIFDNNMDSLDSEMNKLATALAIVQQGDTASQSISAGTLVFWKNSLHIASKDIENGGTFGNDNLTQIEDGGLNAPRFPETRSVTWTYTVEGGSTASTNLKTLIDADLPAGKKCFGICGFESGSTSTHIYCMRYASGNSLYIKNESSSKLTNKIARIHYLCA